MEAWKACLSALLSSAFLFGIMRPFGGGADLPAWTELAVIFACSLPWSSMLWIWYEVTIILLYFKHFNTVCCTVNCAAVCNVEQYNMWKHLSYVPSVMILVDFLCSVSTVCMVLVTILISHYPYCSLTLYNKYQNFQVIKGMSLKLGDDGSDAIMVGFRPGSVVAYFTFLWQGQEFIEAGKFKDGLTEVVREMLDNQTEVTIKGKC